MAVNQGAIQLQVIINNKSLSISKKHLVSLNVKRVIGDSANEFTLEVFDETAYQVENLLIGSVFPSITVKYSASTSLNKSVIFTGMCLDYNTTFTGRAMMLSITGILMTTGDTYDGWWFDKATIEWCGSEPEDHGDGESHEWWIDGKNAATFANYKDNRDVCAIVISNDDGGYTTYFNPGRIFQRIIHKYNGDKLGTGTLSSTYSGSYDAGSINDVRKTVWDALRNAGYSNIATAAVMGNIEWESGFNTGLEEKTTRTDKGYGLCQWTFGRRTNLENYAKSLGKSSSDLGVQINYMLGELTPGGGCSGYASYQIIEPTSSSYDGNKYYKSDWESSTDVNKATVAFMALFERPNVKYAHISDRKVFANKFYASLKNTSASDEIVSGQKYTLKEDTDLYDRPNISLGKKGMLLAGTEIEVIESFGTWIKVKKVSDESIKGYITKWKTAGESTPTGVQREYDNNILEVSGWGTGGTGKYVIAECDETRWIANLNTIQTNETAAQYITRVLCKSAVSDTGKDYADETAGFKYWCDAKGHHFKALDYNKNSVTKINVSYGLRNSQIISFSISNLGAVAMVWGDKNKRDSVAVSSAAMSDLYNDTITAGGENILNANVSQDIIDSNKSMLNWYQDALPAIQVKSSTTESDLSATISNLYNELSEYAISAELTIWGEYSKGYTPGDYLDIIVMTAGGHRHYSSGVYMITSMEDNISGAGYTQTMRLLKLNKKSNSAISNQTISNPSLNIDESGNIIASYTKVTNTDEHTKTYELLDVKGNVIATHTASEIKVDWWNH